VHNSTVRLADPAFRAIFEDSPIGICVIDGTAKVVDVNHAYCEMLGRTEAEVMGANIHDFTHPDDRGRDVISALRVLSGERERYKADKRYIRKDGAVIWARIIVTAVLDPSGKSHLVFSMAQVITEERALRGILPVCPFCKRVKAQGDRWTDFETFLQASANAALLQERCPDCL
jgi:PAS domain S-box-containing protein